MSNFTKWRGQMCMREWQSVGLNALSVVTDHGLRPPANAFHCTSISMFFVSCV